MVYRIGKARAQRLLIYTDAKDMNRLLASIFFWGRLGRLNKHRTKAGLQALVLYNTTLSSICYL